MTRLAALPLALGLAATAAAVAQTPASAVADAARPAADTARDADRKPAAMLAFAKVKPGDVVVDLLAGGGYFTRLFSAAVGPGGKVFAFIPESLVKRDPAALDTLNQLAKEPGRGNVTVVHHEFGVPGPSGVADIEWTSLNYHDLHNVPGLDVAFFNRNAFNELKPGGIYVVVDHAAAPGSGVRDTRTLHRIDPAVVRREVEAAGFAFDGESKALANPADPHTAPVFDASIKGHTDQFAYRFRKPG